MSRRNSFDVYGCDGNGNREKMASCAVFGSAVTVAKSLMHYHQDAEKIRNTFSNEPFGWFHIEDGPGRVLRTFTPECPEGVDPE